jgi:hypothetical protein
MRQLLLLAAGGAVAATHARQTKNKRLQRRKDSLKLEIHAVREPMAFRK